MSDSGVGLHSDIHLTFFVLVRTLRRLIAGDQARPFPFSSRRIEKQPMKKNPASRSAFFQPRFLISSAFCSIGVVLVAIAITLNPGAITEAKGERHSFSVVPFGNATAARATHYF